MTLPRLCFASQEHKYDMHRAIEHYSSIGYEVVQIVEEDKRRDIHGQVDSSVQIVFRLNIPYYVALQEEKLFPTPEGTEPLPVAFKQVDYRDLVFEV